MEKTNKYNLRSASNDTQMHTQLGGDMDFVTQLLGAGPSTSSQQGCDSQSSDSAFNCNDIFIYLFGVLRCFQHCTGHITTGSWKGRGNQYIQFVSVLYYKLPTNGKQLPAFPHEAMTGIEPRPQRWEARVLPLCHRGPCSDIINGSDSDDAGSWNRSFNKFTPEQSGTSDSHTLDRQTIINLQILAQLTDIGQCLQKLEKTDCKKSTDVTKHKNKSTHTR